MRFSINKVIVAVFALVSQAAFAGIETSFGQVANLRIENGFGFIGLSQPMANCGSRVWVDMNSAVGRSFYATALMAFNTRQAVSIRAFDDSPKVFGACTLYDIYFEH